MYLEQLHETCKCQDGSSPMETAALAERTQGPNFAPLDKGGPLALGGSAGGGRCLSPAAIPPVGHPQPACNTRGHS